MKIRHGERIDALRRESTATCAVSLRDGGPASVGELAIRTGLSRPTVEVTIAELSEAGLVRVADANPELRSGGRPARIAHFLSNSGFVIGVEVRRNEIRALIVDVAGTIAGRSERPLTSSDDSERITEITTAVSQLLSETKIPRERILCGHIGVPGIVKGKGTLVLSSTFPGWHDIDMAKILTDQLGFPVELDNDVNLAAVGEQWLGVANSPGDMVLVHLGEQIATGIVLNGQLRRGAHSGAGELTRSAIFLPLDSAGRIVWTSGSDAVEVFAQQEAGDAQSMSEVERFGVGVARTIAPLVQFIDPSVVILGGPLSHVGEQLTACVESAISTLDLSTQPQIKLSNLGSDATALGAVSCALSSAYATLFGFAGIPLPSPLAVADGPLSTSHP